MLRQEGFILVPVLLVFAVIVAVVGDFSYEVYVNAGSLKNYVISQRLSVLASSGLDFAITRINSYLKGLNYTVEREYLIDLSSLIGEENLSLTVLLTDENAKFNLNSFYTHIPAEKEKALAGFRRLLRALQLDEDIAYRISDWIDKDSQEEIPQSEKGAKNRPLYSIEELLQIPGITDEVYERLLPYVTCFTDRRININSAPREVLLTMDGITDTIASAIETYRKDRAFEDMADLKNVPGISPELYNSLQGKYTIKALVYGITVMANESGVKRYIHGVVNPDTGRLKYFREE